ncbi:phospholipase A and acyltransferase 3-like [Ruditapes philippinarum]|uniref:phospholipase A and acyltransferase 3-like n=1 Tax=Ruditapes philippinarum TaxID=129788 RepID=UPI00295BB5C6|nr:phospholipase A and acyltransferase 3-like [Ruditapes philippinarum]XP_060560901.1 phospholipase A and acyltransferase 3-like [Ruditapes philippinarum]XP_060560902.1 phospholipase A and acyltransferase 3-like [Ruditapes philippinarum]
MTMYSHNVRELNTLKKGDLVEFDRGLYSHWAVYAGDGLVIHMTGDSKESLNASVSNSGCFFTICGQTFAKAYVQIDDFKKVAAGSKVYKNNNKDREQCPDAADVIIKRALAKLGEIKYNILWSNCEHFATYCRYGVPTSKQANSVIEKAIIGTGVIAITGITLALQRFVPKEILDDAATIIQGLDIFLEDRTRKRERRNDKL